MRGPERAGDRGDDLLTRRGDHHDIAAAELVVGDELGGLSEHERVDDVVQRLADDRLDLLHIPARAHVGDVTAHAIHLLVVGTRHQEQKLGIGRLQNGPPVN
jgi:hypothetical protein